MRGRGVSSRQTERLVLALQVDVRNDGMCEADLFVQEVDGGRIRDMCVIASPMCWSLMWS